MACQQHGWTQVVLPGDHEPDGTRWPRCTGCGHRCPYAGNAPTETRVIARRHPWYVVTELRGRWRATHWRE
jgi:hypothetical protein